MTVPGTQGSAISYILDENIIKNFKKLFEGLITKF